MAEKSLPTERQTTPGLTQAIRRWLRVVPPGIWIISLVVGVMGGRWRWVEASRPAHREEIIKAFGSMNDFYNWKCAPQMNHDGSRFIYLGAGKKGDTVYLCDTATGRKQVVCEGKGEGEYHNEFNVLLWPWAPDDSAFVYVNDDELVVCPADTNQAPASLPFARTNVISELVWLNPSEFALVANHTVLGQGQRQSDGRWQLHQFPYGHTLTNLAAVGTHEVAWLEDNLICRVELGNDGTNNPLGERESDGQGAHPLLPSSSLVWLNPHLDGILSFNYSKDTGEFLLVRGEKGHNSLWRFDANAGPMERPVQVPQVDDVYKAQWIGKDRFVFNTNPDHGHAVLSDVSGVKKGRLLKSGWIFWYAASPDGSRLLISATISNEPATGFWQYEVATRELQALLPYSDHPSGLVKNLDRSIQKITLPSGRTVECSIFPPAKVDRHKKYPLIIMDSGFFYSFPKWMPVLETCGAYVAITRRGGWWEGMEQMNENLMGAYDYLIQNTNIDARQVYPVGTSAETAYFDKLVTNTPGLWKGVIFVSPAELPDFSGAPPFQSRPRILLTAGGKEHNEARLKEYQKTALNYGVVAEYAIYPEDGHVAVGNASVVARTKDIEHFIFEE